MVKMQKIVIWMLHCSCKNRKYLWRYCKRCWNKFDTSNFELDRPFPKIKNKKVTGLIKDE